MTMKLRKTFVARRRRRWRRETRRISEARITSSAPQIPHAVAPGATATAQKLQTPHVESGDAGAGGSTPGEPRPPFFRFRTNRDAPDDLRGALPAAELDEDVLATRERFERAQSLLVPEAARLHSRERGLGERHG